MTPEEFRRWRIEEMAATQEQIAHLLGLKPITVRLYERAGGSGLIVPPRVVKHINLVRWRMAAEAAGANPNVEDFADAMPVELDRPRSRGGGRRVREHVRGLRSSPRRVARRGPGPSSGGGRGT